MIDKWFVHQYDNVGMLDIYYCSMMVYVFVQYNHLGILIS